MKDKITSKSKVILDITMSLDGFIAGPNDHGKPLHDWLFSGDTPSAYNDFFKLSKKSAKVFDNFIKTTGAIVTGRRPYDITGGWGGNHPFPGTPVFVLSSGIPKKSPEGSTPFTFVSDGIKSAVRQASKAAGKKNVYILGGASIAQQCLNAGLLDEMMIHLVPVLLGGGVCLFDNLEKQIKLEQAKITEAPGVTHLQFLLKESSR
ncbi:MAG TPA: dihydrofolate reductase family protein [Chitinophagaceae bacterium]|nr:dihydrofolate reductase family protein [Chitinophagaceae bacterium]